MAPASSAAHRSNPHLAEHWLETGRARLNSAHEAGALDAFALAARLLDGESDSTLKADALNDLAVAHYRRGNLDLAIDAFGRSRSVSIVIQDTVRVAIAEHNLGLMHLRSQSWAAALRYFEAARAAFDTPPHPLLNPTLYHSAVANDRLGRIGVAERLYTTAIAGLEQDGNAKLLSDACADLAQLQRRSGRQHEAYANARRAVGALRRAPRRAGRRTMVFAATQALRVGRPLEALHIAVWLLGRLMRR